MMKYKIAIMLGITMILGSLGMSMVAPAGAALPPDPPEPMPYPEPEAPINLNVRPDHLSGRWFDPRESGVGVFDQPVATAPALSPAGPPVVAEEAVAGLDFTCVRSQSGGVRCWGDNSLGQLGNGTLDNRAIPGDVLGLSSGVTGLSAFHKHACALIDGGGVKCWGYSFHGELGDGTTTNRLSPVTPVGLESGVTAVAAGGFHSCALLGDGTVKCWGANWHGQLGDGTTRQRLTPVGVDDINSATAITAGKFHTCALLQNRDVLCWGYNRFGQQGNGATSDNLTPKKPVGISNAVAVAAGGLHTCALINDGRVRCWGDNQEGQIGDGTNEQRLIPVNVSGLLVGSGVTAISLGAFHSCAILPGGVPKCWGDNWAGHLGVGSTTDQPIPVPVIGLPTVTLQVSGGDSHTCAVLDGGKVYCWGSNGSGQLGDATSALHPLPGPVTGLPAGDHEVDAGSIHACALTSSGGVVCWGNNKYGQLGDGTTSDRLAPVNVSGLSNGVVALGVGKYHTCAVITGGGLKCWGDNTDGQLGDGTEEMHLTPTDVYGLSAGVVAVGAGSEHTCAVMSGGGVKCWGNNARGRLGDGTNLDRLTPVDVVGLGDNVAALGVGNAHNCVVLENGGIQCWGFNMSGQLGDGTTSDRWTPVEVVGLADAARVSAGEQHTCALIDQNGVQCWGVNTAGELGDGTFLNRSTPVNVVGLGGGVTELASGSSHACAALSTGGAVCWGRNTRAQLGDGTTVSRPVPVAVAGLSGSVVSLAGGSNFSCAHINGEGSWCWGAGGNGQMGDGEAPWRTVPFEVIGLTPATLASNHIIGPVESYFYYTGEDFVPNETITITVNGHALTPTLTTTSEGDLEFRFDTTQADEGDYFVEAFGTLSAKYVFILTPLTPDSDPWPIAGAGPILQVPPGIGFAERLYIPALLRE